MQLDPTALERAREIFTDAFPDFEDFTQRDGKQFEEERDYKEYLSSKARELLTRERFDDVSRADAARSAIETLHELLTDSRQNLMTWRYYEFLGKLGEGEHVPVAQSTADLLFGDDESPVRIERFNGRILPIASRHGNYGPAMTRSFPTLLLWLIRPEADIYIRTTEFQRLARQLLGRRLYSNTPLDAEQYKETLAFADAIKSKLDEWDWRPQDLIDVQTFMYRVAYDWDRAADESDAKRSDEQLAEPFDKLFGGLDEANASFDFVKDALERLGVTGPDDRRIAVTIQKTGSPRLHVSFCGWLLIGFEPGEDDATRRLRLPLPARWLDDDRFVERHDYVQADDEPDVRNLRISRADFDQLWPEIRDDFLASLDVAAAHYEGFRGSVHRRHNRAAVAAAIFDPAAREQLFTEGLPAPRPKEDRSFDHLLETLAEKGFLFPAELVANYILALQTKRFVILSGISGTGKTRLAMAVAEYFSEGEGAAHRKVIAVRPDWTDSRPLLGYFNPLTAQYVRTDLLHLLLEASQDDRPYFIILDEMNLARVEHYFSDFLSCLESDEPITLHDQERSLAEDGTGGDAVPRALEIPSNVFITGTVNVDETTYMFSPKVLDRAFTIELNDVDLDRYATERLSSPASPLNLESMPSLLQPRSRPGHEDWIGLASHLDSDLQQCVIDLHELLAASQRHFGYRVANEIAGFVNLAAEQATNDDEALWAALDLAILQKTLPKLHGTQAELDTLLERLFAFAVLGNREGIDDASDSRPDAWRLSDGRTLEPVDEERRGELNVRLPRTASKIWRMRDRLRRQGFTSFIE